MNSTLSYSPETPNLGQIRRFLEPCDLEIWRMTLKNNRAPLLCYFKLCARFHCHMWFQTGVTVRKRLRWVLTSVTLTFDLDYFHGHHFCPWWKLLKILRWYDDGNIVKKMWRTVRRADGLNQSYSFLVAAKTQFTSQTHMILFRNKRTLGWISSHGGWRGSEKLWYFMRQYTKA